MEHESPYGPYREFIARRRQKRLLELVGKLEWDSTYDYKSERSRSFLGSPTSRPRPD